MPAGRPPKPLEQKRRTARYPGTDSGGRKLPEPSTVVALPMAAGIPDAPLDLELPGREMWGRAWAAAITWLSPDSDMQMVTHACRLADDLAVMRERYHATREPADARAVVALSKEFRDSLASLGFDPTSRARLGVAEVKRVSALEELISRRSS